MVDGLRWVAAACWPPALAAPTRPPSLPRLLACRPTAAAAGPRPSPLPPPPDGRYPAMQPPTLPRPPLSPLRSDARHRSPASATRAGWTRTAGRLPPQRISAALAPRLPPAVAAAFSSPHLPPHSLLQLPLPILFWCGTVLALPLRPLSPLPPPPHALRLLTRSLAGKAPPPSLSSSANGGVGARAGAGERRVTVERWRSIQKGSQAEFRYPEAAFLPQWAQSLSSPPNRRNDLFLCLSARGGADLMSGGPLGGLWGPFSRISGAGDCKSGRALVRRQSGEARSPTL